MSFHWFRTVFWLIPTIGLLVNSFRPAADVANSGWWTGLLSPQNLTLDNYREVLELTYLQKLSGQAIADRLGIKHDNVYKRRERGILELDRILREHDRP